MRVERVDLSWLNIEAQMRDGTLTIYICHKFGSTARLGGDEAVTMNIDHNLARTIGSSSRPGDKIRWERSGLELVHSSDAHPKAECHCYSST